MELQPSNINNSSADFSDFATRASDQSTPSALNLDLDNDIGRSAQMPKKGGVLKGLTSGLGKAAGGVANLFKKHPMKSTGLCIAIGAAVLVAGVALTGGPAGLIIAGALISGGGIGLAVAGLFLEPGKGLYTKGDTRENQIMNRTNESSPTEGLPSLDNPSNQRGVPNQRGVEGAEEERNERSIPTNSPPIESGRRASETAETEELPEVEVKPSVMDRLISGGGRFKQWAGDAIANISERWRGDTSEDVTGTSDRNSSLSYESAMEGQGITSEDSLMEALNEVKDKREKEGRTPLSRLPPLPPIPDSQDTSM